MRIVLDTNILIRANPTVLPTALARDLLAAVLAPPHTLILSTAILVEVDRVLRYPHVRDRWPLKESSIRSYLSLLETAAFMVDLPLSTPIIVEDPDDDPILQTAIVGHADVLCSRDEIFTSLPVKEACLIHGIRVLDDIALRHELRLLQTKGKNM